MFNLTNLTRLEEGDKMLKVKRVLISVSNKEGLDDFVKGLN